MSSSVKKESIMDNKLPWVVIILAECRPVQQVLYPYRYADV
jgi:hypothetical protein